jgi:hypothetical protein
LDLKKFEGEKSKSRIVVVTQKMVGDFAKAVGAQTPELMQDTRELPTFLTCFREGDLELLTLMGIELKNVLHGEQGYQYESFIHAGDHVTYQSSVASVMGKSGKSGSLHILNLETEFCVTQPHPRKIGTARSTIIYRESAK